MYDPKQTDVIQSELANIIHIAMQKGQSYFLIHTDPIHILN
jgi:hypothetical protein